MDFGLMGPSKYYHPEREGAARNEFMGKGFVAPDRPQGPELASANPMRGYADVNTDLLSAHYHPENEGAAHDLMGDGFVSADHPQSPDLLSARAA